MNKKVLAILLFAVNLSLFACGKNDNGQAAESADSTAQPTVSTAPKPAADDPAKEAKKIWKKKCVVCHGAEGKGDGTGASALTLKPRNFGDAQWQASVTDEQIEKTIVGGGMAVGKSPVMPGNPDLKGKKEVVTELAKLVRGFRHGASAAAPAAQP